MDPSPDPDLDFRCLTDRARAFDPPCKARAGLEPNRRVLAAKLYEWLVILLNREGSPGRADRDALGEQPLNDAWRELKPFVYRRVRNNDRVQMRAQSLSSRHVFG